MCPARLLCRRVRRRKCNGPRLRCRCCCYLHHLFRSRGRWLRSASKSTVIAPARWQQRRHSAWLHSDECSSLPSASGYYSWCSPLVQNGLLALSLQIKTMKARMFTALQPTRHSSLPKRHENNSPFLAFFVVEEAGSLVVFSISFSSSSVVVVAAWGRVSQSQPLLLLPLLLPPLALALL